VPSEQLSALFDWLDAEVAHRGCDHSLRLVREWCHQAAVDARPLELWLRENGGCCDCEALANAAQAFEEACREPGDWASDA
jgi:hypothetical protein